MKIKPPAIDPQPIPYEIAKPKVYAVDLDGTLSLDSCWTAEDIENSRPNTELIERINDLYQNNFIIIHTARRHELYLPTINWLGKHGVRYHATRFEKLPCDQIVDLDSVNRIEDL